LPTNVKNLGAVHSSLDAGSDAFSVKKDGNAMSASFSIASGATSGTLNIEMRGTFFLVSDLTFNVFAYSSASGETWTVGRGSYVSVWPVAAGEAVSIGGWA
jgi:hypothetical protein